MQKWGLKPIGRIVDSQWGRAGGRNRWASARYMPRRRCCSGHGLTLADIDYWEINEAFAAQVLGCQAAWKDEAYCREQLDLPGALGDIADDRLNVDGGAVAIGHPVGRFGRPHRPAPAACAAP